MLDLTNELAFNIPTKLSNDVDRGKAAHCGLCSGFGRKTGTQTKLEHTVLVHTHCVLAGQWSLASQLATR